MKIVDTVEIKPMESICIKVNVKMPIAFKFRMRFAGFLMAFASWIIGAKSEIKIETVDTTEE